MQGNIMNREKQSDQCKKITLHEKITLTSGLQQIFLQNMKRGIYQALYESAHLTEEQLNTLLNQMHENG